MTPIENETNESTAAAIIAAYRGEDGCGLEALERLLDDDVVTTDWMYPGETLRGRAAFVDRVLIEAGAAFPDATEEIISTTFDGRTLVVRARFRGTFSAPYYGLEPHFGPLTWQIVDHWHLDHGRIVAIAFAADTAEAHRQLKN
jgi:predicted ester cyclase